MTQTFTLPEVMELLGVTSGELSHTSGICPSVICRIKRGDTTYSVNSQTAQCLADALGLQVKEIAWPRGTSNLGRPPLTGTPLTVHRRTLAVCPRCHLELLPNGTCGYCE